MMGFVKFLLYCLLATSCSCRPNVNGQLKVHMADLLTRLTQMVDKYEQTSDQIDRLVDKYEEKSDQIDRLVDKFEEKSDQIDRLVDKFEEKSDQIDRIELLGLSEVCQITHKIGNTDSTVKVLEDGRTEAQFSCPGNSSLQGSKTLTCNRHGWNGSFPCCHTFKVGDQVRLVRNPRVIGSIKGISTDRLRVRAKTGGKGMMSFSKERFELFPLICSH